MFSLVLSSYKLYIYLLNKINFLLDKIAMVGYISINKIKTGFTKTKPEGRK